MGTSVTALVAASAVLAVLVGGVFAVYLLRNRKSKDKPARRDRNSVIKDANRQLAQNPKDHRALGALADLYFDERAWDKAIKLYRVLQDLSATNNNIDGWFVTMRYGLCAMQLRQFAEAYKALVIARSMKNEAFEINYNLGFLEYKRGNVDRAIQLLREANEAQPDHIPTQRYLGRARFKQKRYREALEMLRRVVDAEPEDRESLLYVAQSHFELGRSDQALQIFAHLRPDPVLGAHASLYTGTIRTKKREYDQAIMDFEIGLRHENTRPEITVELRYRLATAYLEKQEIGKALQQLTEIQDLNPDYKDVRDQISRLQELNSNRHLQTYMMAPASGFVALCRRMVPTFHQNASIKITDVAVTKKEYADILADVSTPKWEDVILFRFIRGTGSVGELMLRELNSRIKEVRAGRGYCVTAGEFSDSAKAFVEARLIDLLGKKELLKILNKVE